MCPQGYYAGPLILTNGELTMKLDKIKFARVIAHCISNGMSAGEYEVDTLDTLIDIDVPQVQPYGAMPADIERLMHLMAEGTEKIEAIKIHRKLTGFGLKESKDAVEKYWPVKPIND
jgi:hypothetical protein